MVGEKEDLETITLTPSFIIVFSNSPEFNEDFRGLQVLTAEDKQGRPYAVPANRTFPGNRYPRNKVTLLEGIYREAYDSQVQWMLDLYARIA